MADRVGQQLGNYRLLRKIGQGAFAEVYLGEHQYLEIPAAIKVLHVQMGPNAHEQFRREARTIAHLQHPHIVRVLEFGIQDQTPYLVIEYAPKGTLRTLHPKGTRLPLEQIVTYVKQLAPALDYAHQQGVIHRDIKPENMLLNAQHEVVLSDFGIAVVQQTRESLSTQDPAGTPLYMAPEQIRGKPCAASDQYSLAVVVYEWLCGAPPFRGSLFEVYSQHLQQPPPGLATHIPHLPPIVEDAVLGALAKDPQQRFTSVQDFATVLEAACDATQPLVSHMLPEQKAPEQYVPSITLPVLQAAPRAGEENLSTETAQSWLVTPQWTADEQEPALILTPSPVARSQTIPMPTKPSVAQKNREQLLRKVRSFWITGMLEHSLHGAALIALRLVERPDTVSTPWQLVLHHSAGTSHPLPTSTRITQVYDAAAGELLILGAPGSGKTTLLLELTRDLLARAEHDEQHPLPVVFNLSSWTIKQQPLADWLVEELNRTYQVPRNLGQTWVDADQILPLLDGLDEVAPKDRTACIQTINTYRQEHGLLPLVVCSRSADYLEQTARVRLGSAVMVQPLTQQQVDDYLAHGGELLWALRVVLHRDAALRELTSTPLMLSILTLTYQGLPVEDLLRGASLPNRQRQVFEHYVERMLRQRGAKTHYTQEQTTHWLSWLARQMKQHNQAIFYIERMQPDWLPESWLHRLYYRILVRLGMGVAAGLIISLTIGIAFGLFIGAGKGPGSGVVSGLISGVVSGLASGLVIALTSRIETEIRPAEVVVWSWRRLVQVRSLKKKLIVGISSGLTLALLMGLALVETSPSLSARLLFLIVLAIALIIVAIIVLAGGLTSGVSSKLQNERDLTLPNQGMRRSLRNSIRIGLIGASVGGSISIMAFSLILKLLGAIFTAGLVGQISFLLLCGSLGGTITGLIVGLPNGGIAYIQHISLQLLLWRSNLIPWNYPRFLNHAAEHLLLRKVGGGYIFLHRLLLDYFASLEAGSPPMQLNKFTESSPKR